MEDFLRDQTSAELTGWLAYLSVDDKVQSQRTTLALLEAMIKAGTVHPGKPVDDDEPIIDTTDPSFAQNFQGFINAPGQKR